MTKEVLKLALEALENNRQTHHYCEDTWYSCPKHEDGCANDSEGDECNCGADKANAEIDKAITAIKEALMSVPDGAQPSVSVEQEPAAWMVYTQDGQSVYVTDNPTDIQKNQRALPMYTTPPPVAEPHKRKPLSDEEIRKANHHMVEGAYDYSFKQGVKWAEYKHGIKD